jgi:methylphosphotriester-DNA--protein-cysteine methyltransferase
MKLSEIHETEARIKREHDLKTFLKIAKFIKTRNTPPTFKEIYKNLSYSDDYLYNIFKEIYNEEFNFTMEKEDAVLGDLIVDLNEKGIKTFFENVNVD